MSSFHHEGRREDGLECEQGCLTNRSFTVVRLCACLAAKRFINLSLKSGKLISISSLQLADKSSQEKSGNGCFKKNLYFLKANCPSLEW